MQCCHRRPQQYRGSGLSSSTPLSTGLPHWAVGHRRWCRRPHCRDTRHPLVAAESTPPPVATSGTRSLSSTTLSTESIHRNPGVVDTAADTTVETAGSPSSSTPPRATLNNTVGHPDCRRRRRWNGCFPRCRQPHCRYLLILIGRCRHRQCSLCWEPGCAGSITRQCCHRAKLAWLTSPVGSPRYVGWLCRFAMFVISLS